MDRDVYAPIASPQLLQAAGLPGSRKVVKPGAGAGAPYAADYSFIFVSETKRQVGPDQGCSEFNRGRTRGPSGH